MSYLGPKSFSTAPLTSSNLAFLNDLSSSELLSTKNNASLHDIREDNNITMDNNNTIGEDSQNKPPINNQSNSPSHLETDSGKEENETLNDKTHASTDSSSNSLSAFSSISTTSTPKSSETSVNSLGESHSHRTLIDLNEEDNKTVILPSTNNTVSNNSPNANDSQLIIPSCPLKTYDVVSVSTSTDSVNDYNNNIHNSNALFDVESISNPPSRFPLLRKKSGELVKSSLKLNSLQRSNSMPNAKSVRFAPRLENIKFFKKSERPTAVSSRFAASPRTHWEFDSNSSSDNDDSGFRHDDDGDGDNEDSFKLNESYEDFLSDDEIDSSSRWIITSNDCPYNPVSLNFAKLGSNNNVILESVKLNSSGNSLIGFVYVKNITFTKKIIVKLTYDNWNSFIEIENANYISSNHIFKYSDSNANNYDKFSFIIKLDNLNTFGNNLSLIFCVQYLANNISFWDNNNGSNYKIVLRKANSTPVGDNSRSVDNSTKNKKMVSGKNITNLLDIEDSNIKLKDNNNFMNSSSSKPLTTDMSSLRISNSFGLKKIRSESSIPSMKSNLLSEFNNKSTSSLLNSKLDDTASPAIRQTKVQFSKSANASPALDSSGFYPNPKEFSDYDHIVKQFCFFTTSDQNKSGTGVGTGLCGTNSINEQTYLDGINHSKSQASLPVDL